MLRTANRKIADPLTSVGEVSILERESERLSKELEDLSENVMCQPEEVDKQAVSD